MKEQDYSKKIPEITETVRKANIGLWAFELDEGNPPRMYVNDAMLGLIGLQHQVSPEETYHAWYDNIDKGSYGLVADAVEKMAAGEHAEVQYPWHNPDGTTMIVRCGGVRDPRYTKGIRIEGTHQDVSAVLHYDIKDKEAYESIISGFAKDYEAVFVWSLVDNKFRVISNKNNVSFKGGDTTLLSEAMQYYADNFIHPDDAGKLDKWLYDAKSVKKKLAIGQPYSTRYRSNADGDYHWFEAKFNRVSDNTVLVGFRDCDDEIMLQRRVEEQNIFTSYFLDSYRSAYYVNIDSRKAKVYKKSNEWVKDAPVLEDFFFEMNRGIDFAAAPEEQETLRKIFTPAFFRKVMQEAPVFTHKFIDIYSDQERILLLEIVRGDDKDHVAVGFKDVTEERRKEQEQLKALEQDLEIIEALAADYSSVYYIDIATEKVTPYSMDEVTERAMSKVFRSRELYPEAFLAYVNKFVYEPDKEKVLLEGRRNNVLKKLDENNSYSIVFRGLNEGVVSFCEMKFVATRKANKEIKGVALGFAYKDNEIMAQYINEKLVAEYISAFMVDLDTDKYRIYRHPDSTSVMERPDRIWSLAMTDFAAECDPEYYELVKNIGSPEYLKTELADTNRREYHYRFPSATQPWRRAVVQVIDRKDGVPSTVVATFMGLDDFESKIKDQEKQLSLQQEQLKEALRMAQSASEAKTRFLFNMSHDIRTPMNAIAGFTDMARRIVNPKEKISEYLEKIDVSGKQLLMLINEVLEMARIESGKVEFAEHQVNVKKGYNAMVTVLSEQAKVNGLTFSHSLKNVKHFDIIADEVRIDQIVMNVTGNAIKYTPKGGSIDFSIEEIPSRKEGYASYTLTVADTGIGMSEEFQKTMFEPFSREKNSTASKIQGTGLGLSIVKNLVDMAGGVLNVQSAQGKGTRFEVTMDYKIDTDAQQEASAAAPSKVDFKGKRVLIVEDNELNREIGRFMMTNEGFETEDAEDGDIAVQKVKTSFERGDFHYYDFILMDIQMPRMNGFEATKRIREMELSLPEKVHIPILAVSANAFDEDRKKSLEAGMDGHLAKPIDMNELLTKLSKF